MKIEQIIVIHLNKNKKVTLQGIGTFYLNSASSSPADTNYISAPSQPVISFQYDANAPQDDSLIDTIVFYSKKLKPLSAADLDSFLNWQKQLLNIHMSFTLQDIGVLQKNLTGEIEFSPYQSSSVESATFSKKSKQKNRFSFPDFKTVSIKPVKKYLPIIVTILIACFCTWMIYLYFFNHTSGTNSIQTKPSVTQNTPSSNKNILPTAPSKQVMAENKNYVFRIVFFQTKNKNEAIKTVNQIFGFGHSAVIYLRDSVYEISMPFNRPLTDTSKILDSLNMYNSLGKGWAVVE